ncbi:MAG: ribonuclease R [Proteobacteria bacterium]|nr:ribonuclease R [Pseudomonadota bacterium]
MPRSRAPKGRARGAALPSRDELIEFIKTSPGRVGKREIARAFGLKGAGERADLKEMLRRLADEGVLGRGRGRRIEPPGRLPEVAVIEIVATDEEGELVARPASWRGEGAPPRILVRPEPGRRRPGPAPGVGDRVLARLSPAGGRGYEARPIRRLDQAPARVLGIYRQGREGGRIVPTDRRQRAELIVEPADAGDARPGELVRADVVARGGGGRGLGLPRARVLERLGSAAGAGAASRIAIHAHDLPTEFPPQALAEARRSGPAPLAGRLDLRALPFVTIDGADARDFDDAVHAAPDPDPANRGGWCLRIAIADVAWYVRPGSALDAAARERGNSVYFPDRVVPMLPEALSNGWCSLRPGEDRPVLAAEVWIDAEGAIRRHRFARATIRSAARLVYEEVEEARRGRPGGALRPLLSPVIAPLYGAYAALAAARRRRGVMELDVHERRIELDAAGQVASVTPRARLDSHRVIEEFMIAANRAAAETLESLRLPCMYRVHDEPPRERLEALRDFLDNLGLKLSRAQVLKPAHFNQILNKAKGEPYERVIHEVLLRSQSQAEYSPRNIGHFALALRRYCHFTSPIRRYADVLVHRALVRGLGLGPGGLDEAGAGAFEAIAAEVSAAERRAVAAEREAEARYVAAFLAPRVGATFAGRISGVARFGLFVALDETGAEGLVPLAALAEDSYVHDPVHHLLEGRRSGRVFRLGDAVEVRLAAAEPLTGSLAFDLLEDLGGRKGAPRRGAGPRRRRR